MDPNYTTMQYNGDIPPEAAGLGLAIFGGILLFILILVLVIYIYMAICLQKIAKKTNEENAWFAWIPILNIILMVNIAKKPTWWIIMFFIPLVNIIFSILVWMEISKKLGKPEWLGVLMIVPLANLVVPGYLAFSKVEDYSTPTEPQPPINPAPTVTI
jgi:hypothetical protein